MRVAILGAGSVGKGYAALLSAAGHEVRLWSPSGAGTRALRDGAPLKATGSVAGEFRPAVAATCAEAVDGAEAAVVAVPGFAHKAVLDALAPCLAPGQTAIISAHYSLSALYLSKKLSEAGTEVPIAAWGTTVTTGRATAPDAVNVSGVRGEVDVAALPVEAAEACAGRCRALFGERFRLREDLLAVALSNLNPPIHMATALGNWTRIERGEEWFNYDGVTPYVGRLIEAMDRERLSVAAAFGLAVRTVQEHYQRSFGLDGGTVAEMAQAVHQRRKGPRGPASPDTRFVTEDVPFGLVPMVAIGAIAGLRLPLHEAGIALFSALYGRDFGKANDILPELGLGRMDGPAFRAAMRRGWPAIG